MRTKATKFMGITVWVDNLKSGEVFIPAGMLGDRFRIWLRTKDITWLENYGTDVICRSFLTDKAPGCQGTFDEKEFAHVHKYLVPLLISYLNYQWK